MRYTMQFLTCLALLLSSTAAAAGDGDRIPITIGKQTNLTLGGSASIENGQFVNSFYMNTVQPNRPWLFRTKGRIDLNASVGDHLTIRLSPEIMLWYDTYTWQTMGNEAFKYPFSQHSDVYVAEGQGILSFDLPKSTGIEFAAGVFPYKYNRDAKNLGEYLFRTGARPAYICTSFDFAYARLSGMKLGGWFFDKKLTADLMLTSENMVLPQRDWSISMLVNYSTPLLSAGAGIMFDRLFPVDMSLTMPKNTINRYYTESNDEEYMSFGGTKLAAHLNFDPKQLFGESLRNRFGENDLKVYAEVAILGSGNFNTYKRYMDPNTGITDTTRTVIDSTKNFYADITQRIPFVFGITLPTFKVLDYLSAEFEYFGWPYPNSTGNVVEFKYLIPQPTPDKVNGERTYELDNWKYSINFKKTVINGFSVIGQFARDHTRHEYFYKGYLDLAEALVQTDAIEKPGDLFNTTKWGSFGWWLKLQYNF